MIDFAGLMAIASGASVCGGFCDIMERQRMCGWWEGCHYNVDFVNAGSSLRRSTPLNPPSYCRLSRRVVIVWMNELAGCSFHLDSSAGVWECESHSLWVRVPVPVPLGLSCVPVSSDLSPGNHTSFFCRDFLVGDLL